MSNVNPEYEKIAVVMLEKRRAQSVIKRIPPDSLHQAITMWTDLANKELEKHEAAQNSLKAKREAAQQFILENQFTPEEAQTVFGDLFGIEPVNPPRTKMFHPVKYRRELGGKTYEWTGVGRRPKAFAHLSAEDLKTYEIKS